MGAGWLLGQLRCQAESEAQQSNQRALAAALVWAVAAMCLAYTPTSLQRRFLLAYTVPLGLLAAAGMKQVLLPWIQKTAPAWLGRRPYLVPYLAAALACLYAPLLAVGQSLYLASLPAETFDPQGWVQAVDWLAKNAASEEAVLAPEQISRLVAARAGLPGYSGQPMETLEYEKKSRQVEDLYSGEGDGAWITGAGVRWIVVPDGAGFAPQNDPALRTVYDINGIRIFEVLP